MSTQPDSTLTAPAEAPNKGVVCDALVRTLKNMNKPSDIKIWLYDSWPITGLEIRYVQTGPDTAETEATITGRLGSKTLRWSTVEQLLSVGVDYNSIARPNYSVNDEVKKWKAVEKENADDLEQLARLKKKLNLS